MAVTRKILSTPLFEDQAGRPIQSCLCSGLKAVADTPVVVKASAGVLRGLMVYTNGTNNATITIYDHASQATGKILAQIVVVAADLCGGVINLDVEAENGLVMGLSGTGCSAIAYYM